ncbi:hypothetical protein [Streptomyces sp. NBC_01304]|uniref:hypothetical protein n=1 Tax=Streptomyces sp. NBC_01304 TaxID=2903818 RepID=UPI002E160152|nr:hypothetical protein OG430_47260 [Streptomyces sp. NBC_01304]
MTRRKRPTVASAAVAAVAALAVGIVVQSIFAEQDPQKDAYQAGQAWLRRALADTESVYGPATIDTGLPPQNPTQPGDEPRIYANALVAVTESATPHTPYLDQAAATGAVSLHFDEKPKLGAKLKITVAFECDRPRLAAKASSHIEAAYTRDWESGCQDTQDQLADR